MNSDALILTQDGKVWPAEMICSTADDGKPCPHLDHGCVPSPIPLDRTDPTYRIDKGKPGDLAPPCAKQKMGYLGHWDQGKKYPEHLHDLRLFKCRMWFWLVIPGLYDFDPTRIIKAENGPDFYVKRLSSETPLTKGMNINELGDRLTANLQSEWAEPNFPNFMKILWSSSTKDGRIKFIFDVYLALSDR